MSSDMGQKTENHVNIDKILEWGELNAYPKDELRAILKGKDKITKIDIFESKLKLEEKLWSLTRLYFINEANVTKIASEFARSVLHYFEDVHSGDSRPREAIDLADIVSINSACASDAALESARQAKMVRPYRAARIACEYGSCGAFWWSSSQIPENDELRMANIERALFTAGNTISMSIATALNNEHKEQIKILKKYL